MTVGPVQAQSGTGTSPRKAFASSLLLPGLGHRAVDGEWRGWGSSFAAVDVGLWISLFAGEWRMDQLVQGYQTLAVSSADAEIAGKDRAFYLNLASFSSSAEFEASMLRTRQWDRVGYTNRPGYSWSWDSTDDFRDFREMRSDAESLRRRRAVVIASLIANRVMSGVLAARKAVVARRTTVSAHLGMPVESAPTLHLTLSF